MEANGVTYSEASDEMWDVMIEAAKSQYMAKEEDGRIPAGTYDRVYDIIFNDGD